MMKIHLKDLYNEKFLYVFKFLSLLLILIRCIILISCKNYKPISENAVPENVYFIAASLFKRYEKIRGYTRCTFMIGIRYCITSHYTDASREFLDCI